MYIMKNQTLIVYVAMLCIYLPSFSQTLNYSGPVSNSLGNVKVFDDSPWATLSNVATLVQQQSLSVGAAYQLRFNMNELSIRAATLVCPTKYGTVSGLLFQSGYSKSNYSRYALSYSRLFGEKVAAGLQFNYLNHQIEAADLVGGFYSSLGITVQTTSTLMVGVFIQNPEQAKLNYNETEYLMPSFFNVALRWSATSHFMVITEFEKQLEYAPVYKCAVQFNFKNKLFVRGGLKGNPVEFTFGGGFHIAGLAIDVGFSHHQQLGLSSGAGLAYSFHHKKQK